MNTGLQPVQQQDRQPGRESEMRRSATVRQNEAAVGRKPRRRPRDVPDSLPEQEQGTDVAPDEVRDPEPPSRSNPPDSLPRNDEDTTRP